MISFFSKLPSIVWVLLIPLGLIVVLGGIILSFLAIANVEGFSSLIFLVIGFFSFRGFASTEFQGKIPRFITAGAICFFALMGMAVDQTGNFIYNKPVEMIYCPQDAHLVRGVDVTHPLPGSTYITQDFVCITSQKVVKNIDPLMIIPVRFGEYVVLGYLLIWVNKLQLWLTKKRQSKS